MEIAQKKFSSRTRFEFGESSLKYTVQDKGGSQSFPVEYGSIPTDRGEFEERSAWYRNIGVIWLAIGAIIIISSYQETGELGGSLWFTLGLGCLAAYWVARTKYTTIDTQNGRIFIIQDAKHDDILQEIESRRRKQLFTWYGTINYENDPARELGKFKWLLDQRVIDDSAYAETANRIKQYHEMPEPYAASAERTIN